MTRLHHAAQRSWKKRHVADSDEELLDSFVQELPEMGDDEDDPSLAEAYSAVLQHKQKKRIASNRKGFGKFFNFKASGEMKTKSKLPNS